MVDIDFAQIIAVDLDQSLVIAVQHLQQPGYGGFARAAAPHDAENGALRGSERHAVERRRRRAEITKSHIIELDAAGQRGADAGLRPALLGRLVDQRGDRLNRKLRLVIFCSSCDSWTNGAATR